MKVDILFNDQAVDSTFLSGHGFSCLVNSHILFDTGSNAESLLSNMKIIGINIADIEAVVISHDHWDHIEGLWEILKIKKGLKVYACPNFSQEFKDKVKALYGTLIEQDSLKEIAGNIFVTGEIPGIYKGKSMSEQSLIVKTEKGLSVITGCSHPGIVNILERVKSFFSLRRFYSVFGGLHLHSKSKNEVDEIVQNFKEMNVEKAGPGEERGTGVPPVEDHGQDAHATLRIRQGAYLPHWTKDGATYSITFRLASSSVNWIGGDFIKYEDGSISGPALPLSNPIFAQRIASIITPAELGESQTSNLSSMFKGASPKLVPSSLILAHFRSSNQGT